MAQRGAQRAKPDPKPLDLSQFEPRSMLHLAETKVPRARFPLIDIHSHLTWGDPKGQACNLLMPPEELLAAMAAEVTALSERLVDDNGQDEALARIEAQWDAVRPTIEQDHPELLAGFDSAMGQVQRSVERRRPADADKATRSLMALIAAAED